MHPHLVELFAKLDASRAAVAAAVDAVPEPVRATRPAPARWSVNEILEHLALVERRFDRVVREAIARTREGGLGPERAGRVAIPDELMARVDSRSERRDAPAETVPTGSLSDRDAWAAMGDARQAFQRTLTDADGLALSEVVAEHQRWGSLTAYQWVELLARHESRHAAQILESAADLHPKPPRPANQQP